jgi:hypothetical protein
MEDLPLGKATLEYMLLVVAQTVSLLPEGTRKS